MFTAENFWLAVGQARNQPGATESASLAASAIAHCISSEVGAVAVRIMPSPPRDRFAGKTAKKKPKGKTARREAEREIRF
jgi:hypothetical protein